MVQGCRREGVLTPPEVGVLASCLSSLVERQFRTVQYLPLYLYLAYCHPLYFLTCSTSFHSFTMNFPRSFFQVAALCLMVFSAFIYFLSSSSSIPSPVSNFRSRITGGYSNPPSPETSTSVSEPSPSKPINNHLLAAIDEPANDPIWDIHNATLGFQKIYAISMPSRTDKRDFLSLMGLVSGLDIEFSDGVNGSEMHPQSFPSVRYSPIAQTHIIKSKTSTGKAQ
jgi:hypothetical protein